MPRSTPFAGERNGAGRVCPTPVPITRVAPGGVSITMRSACRAPVVRGRPFDAPRSLVFKAFTDRALIPQWWGPRGTTTVVDKMQVRPGGIWRFVNSDANRMSSVPASKTEMTTLGGERIDWSG